MIANKFMKVCFILLFQLFQLIEANGKVISQDKDSLTLRLHEKSNLTFYEGQAFELKFILINHSNAQRNFIYQDAWIEQVWDSRKKEIARRYNYKSEYNIDSLSADGTIRLKLGPKDSATIYLRPYFMELYGNTSIIDFVSISDSLKNRLDTKQLPQFLSPGKYVVKCRFYIKVPSSYIDLEIPIIVIPATGKIKEQQLQFMTAVWASINNDINYNSNKTNAIFEPNLNPFLAALQKDTTTIYAADLLSLILPEPTFRPVLSFYSGSNREFKLNVYESVNRQTNLINGTEKLLFGYYTLYGQMPRYWGYLRDKTYDFKSIRDHLELIEKRGYPKELIIYFLNEAIGFYDSELYDLKERLSIIKKYK